MTPTARASINLSSSRLREPGGGKFLDVARGNANRAHRDGVLVAQMADLGRGADDGVDIVGGDAQRLRLDRAFDGAVGVTIAVGARGLPAMTNLRMPWTLRASA